MGSSNGLTNERLRAVLDTARRIWTTSEGHEFVLKPIRALLVERLVNDRSGKPEIPQIEVTIGGKHKRMEANPGDPAYLEALAQWEKDKNFRLTFFLFTAGIQGAAPKAFIEEYRTYFPNVDEVYMKYLWVVSLIPDGEIQDAMEAIMGQTEITQKGLADAASSFPGEGERQPD